MADTIKDPLEKLRGYQKGETVIKGISVQLKDGTWETHLAKNPQPLYKKEQKLLPEKTLK